MSLVTLELQAAAAAELAAPTMAFDRCPGVDDEGREVGGNRRALAWITENRPSRLAQDNERFLQMAAWENGNTMPRGGPNMTPRGGYNPAGIVGGEDGGYYPTGRRGTPNLDRIRGAGRDQMTSGTGSARPAPAAPLPTGMSSPDAFRRGLNSGGDQNEDPDEQDNGGAGAIDPGTIVHMVQVALQRFRSDPEQFQSLLTLLAHVVAAASSSMPNGGETNGGEPNGNGNGSIDRTRQGVSGFNGRGNIGDRRDRRGASDRRLAQDTMSIIGELDRAGFAQRWPDAARISVGNYSGHIESRFRR